MRTRQGLISDNQAIQNLKSHLCPLNNGGEGGIRTLGGVTPTHPFQGCTIGHSVTSP
jgi:hypothetical protein